MPPQLGFKCPGCGSFNRFDARFAGFRAKCPDCGASVVLPSLPESAGKKKWLWALCLPLVLLILASASVCLAASAETRKRRAGAGVVREADRVREAAMARATDRVRVRERAADKARRAAPEAARGMKKPPALRGIAQGRMISRPRAGSRARRKAAGKMAKRAVPTSSLPKTTSTARARIIRKTKTNPRRNVPRTPVPRLRVRV